MFGSWLEMKFLSLLMSWSEKTWFGMTSLAGYWLSKCTDFFVTRLNEFLPFFSISLLLLGMISKSSGYFIFQVLIRLILFGTSCFYLLDSGSSPAFVELDPLPTFTPFTPLDLFEFLFIFYSNFVIIKLL